MLYLSLVMIFFLYVCLSLTKLLELYQKDEVALFKHV